MRFIFRARSIYENMLRNFYYHFVGIDILRGNFIHEGFYVTNKHLITYNGRKIILNDIWFLRSSFPPSYSISFHENKSKFLQDCSWSNKSDDLDGFLMALYEVSGNRYILQFGSEKVNANALKSNGMTFIKLIQE